MTNNVIFEEIMIAPCGINCGTCMAYQRDRNRCKGCLNPDERKPKTRVLCKIKNCEKRLALESRLCCDCDVFPCDRIKHIDRRYSIKYHTSLIKNLKTLGDIGMSRYLEEEKRKWTCPNCRSTLSVHSEVCPACGFPRSAS